jgi:hypothetical protein
VLGHDARVLDRHVPAAKGDHLRTRSAVAALSGVFLSGVSVACSMGGCGCERKQVKVLCAFRAGQESGPHTSAAWLVLML